MCIRVGSFIEGIKSISMEKLDDREHSLLLLFLFFFKGNCRSRKIFVRVVSFSSSMEVAKGENLWEWRWNNRWCGFVTIEETRMKKRGNETTKLTENKDNKDFN